MSSRDVLRVMTCGSVDDGKSTLIGRLLHDSGSVFADQMAQLKQDSLRHGTAGADLDYALLLDGLEAERTQGITIDVAFRYVDTARKRLIIADAPGHAQYTRNMATACSVSDVAIILLDATHGIQPQTRRHVAIAALMGVPHLILAVNKMDAVGYAEATFMSLKAAFQSLPLISAFQTIESIPLSARQGDNVVDPSRQMGWYHGPTLMATLDQLDPEQMLDAPFRMGVQWVNRPNGHFRGYAGTVATGTVMTGQKLFLSGSGQTTTVERIVTFNGDLDRADAGQAMTLVLRDAVDVPRGAVLSSEPVPVSDQFAAQIVWLAETPLVPGRSLLFKLCGNIVGGSITRIRHRLDVETGAHDAANMLGFNEIGRVHLSLSMACPFTPYTHARDLGGFLVIDRQSNATLGFGMIEHELTRAANLRWQALSINCAHRAGLKQQKPVVLWFTGLSGAGKSTIADLVERRLFSMGKHTYLLDGDNIRHGLNRDLGFTEADRVENIRRVTEVAALFADAGLIVIVSFISPYQDDRKTARERIGDGFLELFVDTTIEECRRRDVKGLYARADSGHIPNFTGVTAPYEPPRTPDLRLDTAQFTADALAEQVIALLESRAFLS